MNLSISMAAHTGTKANLSFENHNFGNWKLEYTAGGHQLNNSVIRHIQYQVG